MKKLLIILVAIVLAIFEAYQNRETPISGALSQTFASEGAQYDGKLEQAYKNRQSDVQVQGNGVVIKVLRDDLKGSRHQKFILRVGTDQTVLVAHNIDLAARVDDLKKGDRVEFFGEYEWNARGGIVHWTHKDPKGYHASGWLKHNGRTFQ